MTWSCYPKTFICYPILIDMDFTMLSKMKFALSFLSISLPVNHFVRQIYATVTLSHVSAPQNLQTCWKRWFQRLTLVTENNRLLPFFERLLPRWKIINPWKGKSSSSIQKSILSFEWVINMTSQLWVMSITFPWISRDF